MPASPRRDRRQRRLHDHRDQPRRPTQVREVGPGRLDRLVPEPTCHYQRRAFTLGATPTGNDFGNYRTRLQERHEVRRPGRRRRDAKPASPASPAGRSTSTTTTTARSMPASPRRVTAAGGTYTITGDQPRHAARCVRSARPAGPTRTRAPVLLQRDVQLRRRHDRQRLRQLPNGDQARRQVQGPGRRRRDATPASPASPAGRSTSTYDDDSVAGCRRALGGDRRQRRLHDHRDHAVRDRPQGARGRPVRLDLLEAEPLLLQRDVQLGRRQDRQRLRQLPERHVTVTKYHDKDASGARAASGEPGLPGWTFFVDDDNDGIEDAGENGAPVTDANGQTSFTLKPGASYRICEVLQANWQNSDPGPSATGICKTTGTLELRHGGDRAPVRQLPERLDPGHQVPRQGRLGHARRERRAGPDRGGHSSSTRTTTGSRTRARTALR